MIGTIWSVFTDLIQALGSSLSTTTDSGGGMDPNGRH